MKSLNGIETSYLGLTLKSPIIASSCGLTSKIESIKAIEKAGAGAVVLKSLFEEQIKDEIYNQLELSEYPESMEYISNYIRDNNVKEYLGLIRSAKQACSIPVIASLCCISGGEWGDFAQELEEAGADALELNIFYLPLSGDIKGSEIEEQYLATAEKVVKSVRIPVSVKLSNHFTNPIQMVRELYFRGVKGVTMFNRMYDPDIDVETGTIGVASIFSTSQELRHSLRWIGMASAMEPKVEYSASTGIHSYEDVVKMLLVGASAVQVCSELYQNGIERIGQMNSEIHEWMGRHGYHSLIDYKGKMNYRSIKGSVAFERVQFMKYFGVKE